MVRNRAAQSRQYSRGSEDTILHSEYDFANAREAFKESPFFCWIGKRQEPSVLPVAGAESLARFPVSRAEAATTVRAHDAQRFIHVAADVDRTGLCKDHGPLLIEQKGSAHRDLLPLIEHPASFGEFSALVGQQGIGNSTKFGGPTPMTLYIIDTHANTEVFSAAKRFKALPIPVTSVGQMKEKSRG